MYHFIQNTYSQHRSRGVTLVELIFSIGILVMIMGGIIAFERSVLMNTRVIQSEFISQQQVRKTLSGFVADVRAASPSGAGAYAISSAGTSSLVIYANVDKDALVERVRYFLATTSLMRGILKPTGTTTYNPANEQISFVVRDVMNGTTTPTFTYYDKSYDGFTASSTAPLPLPIDIPAVRLIKISLTVNPNGVRAPVMQTYTTQVMLRNLKDNL